jgi:hypothetical protein
MPAFRFCSPLLAIFLLTALTATANTCDSFASFTCSKSTPDLVHLVGTGATGQSVGIVLGNTFNVTFMGNKSFLGDDLVILAAAPNGLTGSVNGVSFSSLSSFPEGGAMGAIEDTWKGTGVLFHVTFLWIRERGRHRERHCFDQRQRRGCRNHSLRGSRQCYDWQGPLHHTELGSRDTGGKHNDYTRACFFDSPRNRPGGFGRCGAAKND